ncbi:hypothetical protein CHS0354_032232 [Potamilus streckersoni]|uniref:CUB domain-containing protein n=1 Tax=Potamilus streckersoni TaxID=2493646 RepID=A0AAE0VGJ9_9BIVA|nr:hypothetical protein CHS0354_032232 [Potamilus streckersoni]
MDVIFFIARLTLLFLVLLKDVYTATPQTYRMEEYCQGEISMIMGDFHSGKLVFHSDGMSNCSVTVASWYTEPYIQFYFEDFEVGTDDCLRDKLMIKDGNSVYSTQITGLGSKLCGSEKPDDVYRTFTRYLRIEYETRRVYPGTPVHFSIIFNAFDVGICDSWEIRCDNGRCIQDEMNCNGYNPCGDHSDCKLPVGSIVGIVIGSLAGLAIVMTVIVVSICCYRRRKFRNMPSQGRVPNTTTGYVISTFASHPGAIPSSSNPWYSTGHQQVLLGTAYENSPVPPMPPAQISSQPEK